MTGARSLLLPHSDALRSVELAAILRGHTVGVAEIFLPGAGEMRLVRWLAGYRFTRLTLSPQDEQQVRDVCSDASSVSATVTSAARLLPYSESAVRANLYSQIWRRTITLLDPRDVDAFLGIDVGKTYHHAGARPRRQHCARSRSCKRRARSRSGHGRASADWPRPPGRSTLRSSDVAFYARAIRRTYASNSRR